MEAKLVIGDRAWHLRLVRWQFHKDYQPRDLCSHFWIVVAALLYLPARPVGALFWAETGARWLVRGIVVLVALGGLTLAGIGFVQFILANPLLSAAVAGGVLTFVVGVVVWQAKQAAGLPREPSLVMSYIKAKKRRGCPLIEVRKESAG